MRRIIFNKEFGFLENSDTVTNLVSKLQKSNFTVTASKLKHGGHFLIMLKTEISPLVVLKTINAKNFKICDMCQTIHFRIKENITAPFSCPCGKTINKIS